MLKRDDFDAWKRDPVTKWILKAVKRAADAERAEWMRQSWDSGVADPAALLELRTRALALTELADNDFETWQQWNGETPPDEPAD